MRRMPLLVGLGCLLALLLACYWAVLFRDHQFAYRDAGHFYYPLYLRVQQEWAAGRLPLWEPEENAGMPLLGNPTAAVLYLGKLIFTLAPSYAWGVRLYTIAHTLLAACGMFALMRHWGVSKAGSGLSALAYAFGAPILFQYCNIIFLVGAAWLPLGLMAADRWLRLGRRWAIGELALVMAMQTLGGDPQVAYVTGLCAGGYALGLVASRNSSGRGWPGWAILVAGVVILAAWSAAVVYAAKAFPEIRPVRPNGQPPAIPLPWMAWVNASVRAAWVIALLVLGVAWARRPGPRALPTMLAGLLAAAGLSACLMAVQLLPVLEFTSQSVRAANQGPHDIYPFSLEPARLAELAFPGLFGGSSSENRLWLALVPPRHEPFIWVNSLYLGIPTLVLALTAVGFRGGPPWRAWLSAIAIVSVLAALGRFGSPIWLARCVPGMAEHIGAHDRFGDAAIRFDKYLRDGDGGFYWLLATVLPGFKEFRYPSKLLTFTCAALAGLAGLGWDRVAAGLRRRAIGVASALAAVGAAGLAFALAGRGAILGFFRASPSMALGGVFGPFDPDGAWRELATALGHGTVMLALTLGLLGLARRRRTLAGVLMVAALTLDLAVANSGSVMTVPQSMFETPSEILAIIERAEREDPTPGGLYRIHRTPIWNPYIWRETSGPGRHADFVRWERETLQPKYGITEGVHYTFTEGTAELYDYVFFFSVFERHIPELAKRLLGDASQRVKTHARRGYDLWNTRYFILPFVFANDEYRSTFSFEYDSEVLAPDPSRFRGPENEAALDAWRKRQDWQVRRNHAAYPRAWVVHDAKIQPPIRGLDRESRTTKMEEILYQGDLWRMEGQVVYDPKSLAWVEAEDPAALVKVLSRRPFDPEEVPRITKYEPTRVEMQVDLKTPGLVVLADVYYPGWKLTIDGEPSTIYRTNRMMRGAAVESGKHTLVYTYDPGSFRVGVMFTLLGLFGLGALGLWSYRRPVVPALVGGERGGQLAPESAELAKVTQVIGPVRAGEPQDHEPPAGETSGRRPGVAGAGPDRPRGRAGDPDQVVGGLGGAGVALGHLGGVGHEHRLAAGGGLGREAAEGGHEVRVEAAGGGVAEVAAVQRVGQHDGVDPVDVLGDLEQLADAPEPGAEGADHDPPAPRPVGEAGPLDRPEGGVEEPGEEGRVGEGFGVDRR